MERHWQAVTRRLSEATARDIAALNDALRRLQARRRLRPADRARTRPARACRCRCCRPASCRGDSRGRSSRCSTGRCRARSASRIKQPFWIDTVGNSGTSRSASSCDEGVLRFVATRSQTYASNSHIFLIWMVGTSVVLLASRSCSCATRSDRSCGWRKLPTRSARGGRRRADFTPRGAREVRQAAQAFIEMRDRIRQHVDQRTTMLAGVSHDLRTILTRFKLRAGAARRQRPRRRAMQRRRQRDAAHAGGLSGLHPRRRRRGGQADQHARAAGGDPRRGADLRRADRAEAAPPHATSWCCP